MSININWKKPQTSGVRRCLFRHEGDVVEMSAAVCVQNTWKGMADSASWLTDRDTWAQSHAQTIIDRREYAASPAGLREAAQAKYNEEQDEIDRATVRREELKIEHPELTERVR